MKNSKIILLYLFFMIFMYSAVSAQQSLLQSGPMVGYSTMRETALWVQTKTAAKVKINYWVKSNPKIKFSTKELATEEKDAYTAHLIADKVEPGQKYNYELLINGKKAKFPYELKFQTPKLWQWREDPPEFSFVTGSCLYINEDPYDRPGKPYGSDFEILKSIYSKDADFMVWLGDNLYLREVDWDSWTGIIKRYTHDRAYPDLQPILASMSNYAIWDDHDYGPNDSDRGFYNKEMTLKAFKLFWANPTYGINGGPGITTYFQWGDVDFFLLDDRTFRAPDKRKTGAREMLGDEQLNWLIDNLATSQAPFKIIAVGGQVLNPAKLNYVENYERFPEEKEKLLSLIREEGITGVVFLDGDRHHSEITKLKREGTYPLYDFTVSSFTAGVSPGANENNTLRLPGKIADEHNFAVFNFSGPRKNRQMKMTLFDKNGKELWNYIINENELK